MRVIKTSDLRVLEFSPLSTPIQIKSEIPISEGAMNTVASGRREIREMLTGHDRRLLVIVGPCSIHDPEAAVEYARRLAKIRAELSSRLMIAMRVYFEKPRTTVGWKGLISDPRIDGTSDIDRGIRTARKLLRDINELGLPVATEFLDPIVPPFTSDLVSWAAIGARTTESQTHREMASGLSMPVGFKNSTDGNLKTAVDAMASARHTHSFLGIDQNGMCSIVRTSGNPDVHVVLRGGGGAANYSAEHIQATKQLLAATNGERRILVDCSHGNSNKDHRNQPGVFDNVLNQYLEGEQGILGLMLESNLFEGNQSVNPGESLKYGVSITDACISWETTEELLRAAYSSI